MRRAIAKSHGLHPQDTTLANLYERFMEQSANGREGRIKVDDRLPGIIGPAYRELTNFLSMVL